MRRLSLALAVLSLALTVSAAASPVKGGVQVVTDEAKQRVDITIDGQPFTSYIWGTMQRKPVLYPLIAPGGIEVTRGYPFNLHPGERVDHPHHAGLWFNYGSANGHDYWNNSDAIKEADRPKYGSILPSGSSGGIISTHSGPDSGELITESVWYPGDHPSAAPNLAGTQPILKQHTRYVFSKLTIDGKAARAIDLIVTLTALTSVTFNDDKEGLLGIRVAQFLESANEKSGTYFDASGKPTNVNGASPGANGVYLTSEGKKGDDVWSTRGRWCILIGTNADQKTVTIAILDNPKNPNYPTYWHARGYGLFAANPLGQHIFDPKAPQLNYTVDAGHDVTFRYRVLLLPGAPTPAEMNKQADTFSAEYK
jgi:hypothetical protein